MITDNLRDNCLQLLDLKHGFIFDSDLLSFSNDLKKSMSALPPIYRYMQDDKYCIESLKSGTLYLSPIGTMNDIFEGFPCETGFDIESEIDALHESAYIKSFSECRCNLLLWGLYANNYKGLCIKYDLNLLPEDSPVWYHLFPVIYSQDRAQIDSVRKRVHAMRQLMDTGKTNDYTALNDIIGLYLMKSIDWAHEREWRIAVSYIQMHHNPPADSNETASQYAISQQTIAFDCVSEVILGPRMTYERKRFIWECVTAINKNRELEKRPKVRLYTAKMHEKKYTLDYNEEFPIEYEDDIF